MMELTSVRDKDICSVPALPTIVSFLAFYVGKPDEREPQIVARVAKSAYADFVLLAPISIGGGARTKPEAIECRSLSRTQVN